MNGKLLVGKESRRGGYLTAPDEPFALPARGYTVSEGVKYFCTPSGSFVDKRGVKINVYTPLFSEASLVLSNGRFILRFYLYGKPVREIEIPVVAAAEEDVYGVKKIEMRPDYNHQAINFVREIGIPFRDDTLRTRKIDYIPTVTIDKFFENVVNSLFNGTEQYLSFLERKEKLEKITRRLSAKAAYLEWLIKRKKLDRFITYDGKLCIKLKTKTNYFQRKYGDPTERMEYIVTPEGVYGKALRCEAYETVYENQWVTRVDEVIYYTPVNTVRAKRTQKMLQHVLGNLDEYYRKVTETKTRIQKAIDAIESTERKLLSELQELRRKMEKLYSIVAICSDAFKGDQLVQLAWDDVQEEYEHDPYIFEFVERERVFAEKLVKRLTMLISEGVA